MLNVSDCSALRFQNEDENRKFSSLARFPEGYSNSVT